VTLPSPYSVQLIDDAARDLDELYAQRIVQGSSRQAERLLDGVEDALRGLYETPGRGVTPPELLALGTVDYQEVRFDSYRVVYRVAGTDVFVLLISDGRRDLETLLQRRLFEA
jgi:toxin ParE1/3/4